MESMVKMGVRRLEAEVKGLMAVETVKQGDRFLFQIKWNT